MTQKDFKLIANVLRIAWLRARWKQDSGIQQMVILIIEGIAAELARTSPRFITDKFRDAIYGD